MTRYTVTQTIQSNDTSNPPVEQRYYRGTDLGQALAALVQAAVERDDSDNVPEMVRFRVLGASFTRESDPPSYYDAKDRALTEQVEAAMQADGQEGE